MTTLDLIGWTATAAFSASYFVRGSKALRWVQAAAALIWIVYGSLLHAMPVIVANVIVALAALGSSLRRTKRELSPDI